MDDLAAPDHPHGWTPDAYDLLTGPCRDVLGIPAKWADR